MQILEIHGKRDCGKARTKVTLERQVFLSAGSSTSNPLRSLSDSELEMTNVGAQFSRKRKISSPDKSVEQYKLCASERFATFLSIVVVVVVLVVVIVVAVVVVVVAVVLVFGVIEHRTSACRSQ